MAASLCWTCAAPATHKSTRIGAAVCGAECRDAAHQLRPVAVGADTLAARVLAAAQPSLAGPGGRWRADGGLVVPARVAARLQHIGPKRTQAAARGTDTGGGGEEEEEEEEERAKFARTTAGPPQQSGEYGFLSMLVHDIRQMTMPYLSIRDYLTFAPTIAEAYAAATHYMATMLNGRLDVIRRDNITLLDLIDFAGLAASRNDRVAFNDTIHMAVSLALVQLYLNTYGTKTFFPAPLAKPLYWPIPRILDYAQLCTRDALVRFLWLWHLRRTYPHASFIGSAGAGGVDLLLADPTSHRGSTKKINWALILFLNSFVRAHDAVYTYEKDVLTEPRKFRTDGRFNSEPFIDALLVDMPVETEHDDDDSSEDDVTLFAYSMAYWHSGGKIESPYGAKITFSPTRSEVYKLLTRELEFVVDDAIRWSQRPDEPTYYERQMGVCT